MLYAGLDQSLDNPWAVRLNKLITDRRAEQLEMLHVHPSAYRPNEDPHIVGATPNPSFISIIQPTPIQASDLVTSANLPQKAIDYLTSVEQQQQRRLDKLESQPSSSTSTYIDLSRSQFSCGLPSTKT